MITFSKAIIALVLLVGPVTDAKPGLYAVGEDPSRTVPVEVIIQPNEKPVNVLDFGVRGDGVTDDAPALRAIFAAASGMTILVPPGHTYLLKSVVSANYPFSNNVALRISGQHDFDIVASGATFRVDPSVALSQTVLVKRSAHWHWDGGIIVGNRSGLAANQENVGFGLFNNRDFHLSPQRVSGFGGNGGAFVGDYNVNFTIDSAFLDGVGIGFDTAFSKNGIVSDIKAVGADADGLTGSGHVGQRFFSNIFDVPLAPTLTLTAAVRSGSTMITYTIYPAASVLAVNTAYPLLGMGIAPGTTLTPKSKYSGRYTGLLSRPIKVDLPSGATVTAQFNFTGVDLADTDQLVIQRSDFSNFNTGIAIASGANYRFSFNKNHDNPGLDSSKGIGYYFYYVRGGLASSVGHPVHDVKIEGGSVANNGSSTPGAGVIIDSSPISNQDIMHGFYIHHLTLDNNIPFGVSILGGAVANIAFDSNRFIGSAQKKSIDDGFPISRQGCPKRPGARLVAKALELLLLRRAVCEDPSNLRRPSSSAIRVSTAVRC